MSYPFVAYSGITPDNRELIIANLADNESPQRIFHLYQNNIEIKGGTPEFICFVGKLHDSTDAEIFFLTFYSNEMYLNKIVKK